MRITPIKKEDKTGRIITLRNAEISDADNLITYMKITSFETPFLLREPDVFRRKTKSDIQITYFFFISPQSRKNALFRIRSIIPGN